MKIFVVLGSGTDVGKTYITSKLIKSLRREGKKVYAIKPVISGYDDLVQSDISILADAIGESDKDNIVLYKLKEPLSPDIAAKNEGIEINIEEILNFCIEKITHQYAIGCEYFFIETAGGLLSPIADLYTCLDFAKLLEDKMLRQYDINNILVAKNFLGVISICVSALISFKSFNFKNKLNFIFNDIDNDKNTSQVYNNIKSLSSKYLKPETMNFFENYLAFLQVVL